MKRFFEMASCFWFKKLVAFSINLANNAAEKVMEKFCSHLNCLFLLKFINIDNSHILQNSKFIRGHSKRMKPFSNLIKKINYIIVKPYGKIFGSEKRSNKLLKF